MKSSPNCWKHPEVIFQSCSGGGRRVDLGILRYFDQVRASDNTDAFDRLFIQEGFSYAYCAKIMEAWVTSGLNWVNQRRLSLKYRFHSAMMGNIGIGDNLLNWSNAEKDQAWQLIGLYKKIRKLIQHGRQYCLLSPRISPLAAVMYINESPTEAVLFAFLHFNHFGDELPRIYLKGLKEDTLYMVEGKGLVLSGKALMKVGIQP
jgi:alpha-galactosidase